MPHAVNSNAFGLKFGPFLHELMFFSSSLFQLIGMKVLLAEHAMQHCTSGAIDLICLVLCSCAALLGRGDVALSGEIVNH